MGLEYLLFKTGPLTMPPSQLGAFARSDPAQPTPNIEWHVQPLSLDKFGDPLHPFPAITPSVCNLRPTSRGWVRILSPDPAAYPGDQAELPVDAGGPQGRRGRHALHAPHHGGEGAGEIRAGGVSARARRTKRSRAREERPASWAPPSSTRSAPARWAATPWRWWTTACACAASGACG